MEDEDFIYYDPTNNETKRTLEEEEQIRKSMKLLSQTFAKDIDNLYYTFLEEINKPPPVASNPQDEGYEEEKIQQMPHYTMLAA